MHLAFSCSSSLLVMLPHILALIQGASLLVQISATCSFVSLSVYFSREMIIHLWSPPHTLNLLFSSWCLLKPIIILTPDTI